MIVAASSLLSAPLPEDALTIFSADDMPSYVQIAGINRVVSTRTTISPDGTAQDCGLERSSGDPKLDLYTCAIILKRAKFRPATWIDGSPAYAVLRAPVTWAIGGSPSEKERRQAYPPDIDLSVIRLPDGAKSSTWIRSIIAVDEAGHVIECDGAPPVRGSNQSKQFPELVQIGCGRMKSTFIAAPARDSSGKAVRSIQNAFVTFETGS